MKLHALTTLLISIFTAYSACADAGDPAETVEGDVEAFDPETLIMHHIKDAYGFHITDIGGHPVSISLPVILWTDNGLTTFMSSAFHHDHNGEVVVEKNGNRFVNFHEKIYQLDSGAETLKLGDEGHPTNGSRPKMDISITKNVFVMLISATLLLLIFIGAARRYRKSEVPTGLTGFVEPLVLFVRDDIAIPNIGEKKYARYMPFLLTVFFFIWLNNIFGLIPIINNANVSGNIAFTMTLALFTFIITTASSNKHYWKHIFLPAVPWWMYPIMVPVEIIGIFTKPLSLMIRLFANITAGHIIILSLVSLIFIFKNIFLAPVSVGFALFIGIIEIIITAIQAYIFTVLSALYFGMATEEAH